ncbi:MAG TPA: HAD family hydrolase [Firmicutes bacterium]|nr:HAD family hydrolase [Bacillota bacterium]
MKYKLAIFDLDGTLLDTLDDLADSLSHTLAAAKLPPRTRDETRRFVGNGIRKLIERAVPTGSQNELIDTVEREFRAYYKLHCADKTKPYDGIIELLRRLRAAGVLCAVVSNKGDFAVQELAVRYFSGLLDCAVGERAGVRTKPSPDSVNEVLRTLGVDRADAVYIGDSDVDIDTAKNAGMDSISVLWGFRDREFLVEHGAVRFVGTPREIGDIVLG